MPAGSRRPSRAGTRSLLLSANGEQLVSTRLAWGTPLLQVNEPDSLKRLVDKEAPVVGVIKPFQPGGAEHLFTVRVPVLREGLLKYALSAVVNVETLERVVPRQLPGSEEWTRTILDPEGTIGVRTRGAETYVGTRASEAFRALIRDVTETVSSQKTREGIPVYAATSRGTHGWTAVVVVTQEALDAPLHASMAGLLIGGGLLMLCGLAAVLRVSRRLSVDLAAATPPPKLSRRAARCRRRTATSPKRSAFTDRSRPRRPCSSGGRASAMKRSAGRTRPGPKRRRPTRQRISSSRCSVTSCAIPLRPR